MKMIMKIRTAAILVLLLGVNTALWAQDKALTEQKVKNWLEQYWMWVVAGVVLLVLIIVISSRRSRVRRTTTVVKDNQGHVKSVTTTEVKE